MFKKSLFYLICFSSLLIALISCKNEKGSKIQNIAEVNGEVITKDEFIFYLNKYAKSDESLKGEDAKKKLIEKLVDFKRMLSVARTYGIENESFFKTSYNDYLRQTKAELYKKKLASDSIPSDDIINSKYEENNKDKKRSEAEEKDLKERLKKNLFNKNFNALLNKELENLKKQNIIIINEDALIKIDSGEEVSGDEILFEVNDEKYSYNRVKSLIPSNVRHSSSELLKKRKFLEVHISEEIDSILLSLQADKLNLAENDPHFNLNAKEYYEKLLVNSLDYNKEFIKKVYSDILTTDDEIQDYYNKKVKELEENITLKVNILTFKEKDYAISAKKDLDSGMLFKNVLENYSGNLVDTNTDLGFISKQYAKDQYGTEFIDKVFKLKEGDVSDVITLNGNFIVAKIDSEMKNQTPPLDEIKEDVKKELQVEKAKKAFQLFWDDMKGKSEVTINEKMLKNIKWN